MIESKPNLLFIIPNFFYIEDYQKLLYHNDIPLGTLQLSSLLKEKAGVQTDIIDFRRENETYSELNAENPHNDGFRDAVINVLEKNEVQEYQNIGINCYTSFQYLSTDSIAKIIKKEFPNINIIVGGYHPSAVPEDFIYKDSPFDIVVKGEADEIMLDLFNSKSNIIKKSSETRVLESNILIDVNILPFPDYELYLERYPLKNNFKFEMYMSRGCPYQCAFCATNYDFRSYRFDNFKAHFKKLMKITEEYDKKIKIGFADQSFNRVSISEKVLQFILDNELQDRFSFSCQSRVETVSNNTDLIKTLRKCGMVVGYGFETANKLLLKEMHKTDNPTNYIKMMEAILNDYKNYDGPYCRLNLVAGFPSETEDSFNDTIDFVNKHGIHGNIQISPSLFSNYPNVFVYKNLKYFEDKFGTEFIKKWWKMPSNPLKNSVPRPSKDYSKKKLIEDYKNKYTSILKLFRRDIFADLVVWKSFFNKWYEELE